ncbi:asparaginase [Corynebacterium caspium]|uniref:asparaginase n=1 Tax=Corynebacterium caspium TaxID=234828 RepID=UPI000362E5D0|nr:asparaginase [Corynebacterium caspium]WKD58660.1 putative L-asparaginase [Corynebacterium caspium DSM 44850]
MNDPKPVIYIGSLGGTIAMKATGARKSVTPQLQAEDLVAAVPELGDIAEIKAQAICNIASPALQISDILQALAFAEAAVRAGATGIVLTHGTDTLEESAYFLDLLWEHPVPIVLTGAMRNPSMTSPDGPANLLAAVITASSSAARGLGVLAVLDDTIHLARLVRKTDTTAVWTFQSPGWGPIGRVVENRARFMWRPFQEFSPLPKPSGAAVNIPIVEVPHSDDGSWLKGIASTHPRGLMLVGSGAGHIAEGLVDPLTQLLKAGLPVILGSRVFSGTILSHTYGYKGSEEDLLARGVISAGFLAPAKARILLYVLLEAGYSLEQIRAEFALRG